MKERRSEPLALKVIRWLIILAIVLLVPVFIWEAVQYQKEKAEFDSIPEMSDIPATADMKVLDVPQEEWPKDKLFLEKSRADFTSGALHFKVPVMGVDDEVMDGTDMLYLYDTEWIYAYVYRETLVVEPVDVSVLYLQGYPCLTLTSCHPKGKNTQRIVVHAELAEIYPYSADFDYHDTASAEELAALSQTGN